MTAVEVNAVSNKFLLMCCLFMTFQLGEGSHLKSSKSSDLYGQSGRIVGGVSCSTRISFIASLQQFGNFNLSNWKHFCGGAIITNKHVLTAAHCLRSKEVYKVSVYVGSNMISSGGVRHLVVSWIQHPDYAASNSSDIAVVKIEDALTWSENVQRIEYHNPWTVPAEKPCLLYGWGKTTGSMPDKVQCIQSTTLSVEACQKIYIAMTKNHLCSFGGPEQGTCSGDSGGPVTNMNGNLLLGVVYGGPRRCGTQAEISIRVSPFIKWIDESIST